MPISIKALKNRARTIKRCEDLRQGEALNRAARENGFENYRHAKHAIDLASKQPTDPLYPLYVTAYWRTPEGESGRETLRVMLKRQWTTLLSKAEMETDRGLQRFRVDADDHLEMRIDAHAQHTARERICEAVRSLQFMEAIGVRPATGRNRALKRGTPLLPGFDHGTLWTHPEASSALLVDEPYAAGPEFLGLRQSWAADCGYAVGFTEWPGMYLPPHSSLYLVLPRQDEALLAKLIDRLDKAPAPQLEEPWSGESAAYAPTFITPGRVASGRPKRSRLIPPRVGTIRRNAIVYCSSPEFIGWRPDATLPLHVHRQLGRAIGELFASTKFPSRLGSSLIRVRSTLEQWMELEHREGDLPVQRLADVYRNAPSHGMRDSQDLLILARTLLLSHYPECAPRSELLRLLERCRRQVEREARRGVGVAS